MGARRAAVVEASVIVPTLGRMAQLRTCLDSLAVCDPLPSEVLLVAQDHVDEVVELAARYTQLGVRVVPCAVRGVSSGRNKGFRAAAHDIVLVTDDDCTVAPDWVAVAMRLMAEHPRRIVTGRVLPAGDARAVPSAKTDEEPQDFTGKVDVGALFPNNMVADRTSVLAEGGFDERFSPAEAAEDNEFCYRWLRAGRSLRYEPSLVVWHHDWRSPAELERLYVAYARGQGFFYAKHLLEGDLTMLRLIGRDLYWGARGVGSAVLKRRARWTDPRRGILRGLPVGLWRGWCAYGPSASRAQRGHAQGPTP